MVKILISDAVDAKSVDVLTGEGFSVDYRPGLPATELLAVIGEYDVLVVRSSTQVTEQVIATGHRLKIIGRAGAGVDNIDIAAATRKGIIVMNTPGGNTISTAEHTMSLLLSLARSIPQANRSLSDGLWDRKTFIGTELYGKTLGVVGLGKVGKEVARRCAAFEMKIIAFDPVIAPESAKALGVELVEFDELLKRSDIITLHTPFSNETKGLIGEAELAKCKNGVRIINCARGGIVNEEALLKGLNDGKVAGAALDVFVKEPPGKHPLIAHPRVVATPHLGASTEEAQEKVAIQVAHQIADALLERGVAGSVNAEVVASAMKGELLPYLDLANRMGQVVAQLLQGQLRSITIQTGGEMLKNHTDVLSAAVLKGMFGVLLDEPVNYINAPMIAEERGIHVQRGEMRQTDAYPQIVSVQYETDAGKRSLAGTVFGKKDPRLVEIDGFRFEVRPEGSLLFYLNADIPGMLATVSSVLAAAKINIGGLSLGRHRAGEQALTIVNLDSQVSESVLQEIRSLQGVTGVRSILLK
jgi:D-3-phosphoglycerate dehydrogenase